MPKIGVALIGVGNCSSALLQGLQYYGKLESKDSIGVRNPTLGGLTPKDIQVVAAFDVDERKVGKDLSEAIFASPNNAPRVAEVPKTGVTVQKGPLLDGLGKSTQNVVIVSSAADANVAKALKIGCATLSRQDQKGQSHLDRASNPPMRLQEERVQEREGTAT